MGEEKRIFEVGILPKRVYGAWGWGTPWPKKKKEKKNVRVAGWPIECIQKHARLPLFLQGSTSSFFFFFFFFVGVPFFVPLVFNEF